MFRLGKSLDTLVVLLICCASADAQTVAYCDPPAKAQTYEFRPMASVPDLNGDGIDDVLVGAPDQPVDTTDNVGIAYLYSGNDGRMLYSVISPLPGSGRFGQYVAGIRDLDGDGAGDFVVTTLFEHAAYLFSGATGTLLRTLYSPNGEGSCRFGEGLAVIPDVDGDGFDEIGVGATCEFGYGRFHLYSGATGAYLRSFSSPGEGNGTRYFGEYSAGIPDVDGDGAGDVLFGDPWVNRPGPPLTRGAAYIFSGGTGKLLHTIECPDRPFFFGENVAGVPDLDGDDRGDVLVSGDQHDTTRIMAGKAYVYSGATGSLVYTLSSPNNQQEGRFGWGLSGSPDIDGDGMGDLLIGALGETPPGLPVRAGSAYLFSGRTGEPLRRFVSPSPRVQGFGTLGEYVCVLRDPFAPGGISFGAASYDCASVCDPFPRGRAYVYRFCRADWNYDGAVDSRDFFAFLHAFFDARADFNKDSRTNSSDFFEYITAFFEGCAR